MKAVLYMVIPCYNEEEVLPVTWSVFRGITVADRKRKDK